MSAATYRGNFPPDNLQWEQIIPLLGETHAAIARYDSMLAVIHNKEILLSPLTTQEAVLSSRIEGTQATMAEVLQLEAQGDDSELPEHKRLDIYEIVNYRNAMTGAVKDLKKLPICNRMILKAHKTLMSGVRGHNKAPGKYRKAANWIGPAGCAVEQAYYIPPDNSKIPDLMSRWEKYINGDAKDTLVQLALMHAEFEAIHPFLDGNGRLGRMLIPLFLLQKTVINASAFYISAYLEAHRDEYYRRLRAISHEDDWTGWCIFFLQAIRSQAKDNLNTVTKIFNLYNSLKERMPALTHSQFGITVLDAIFEQPYFQMSAFVDTLNVQNTSARRLVKILEDNNILKTHRKASGRNSAVMIFPQLLNIAEGKEVF